MWNERWVAEKETNGMAFSSTSDHRSFFMLVLVFFFFFSGFFIFKVIMLCCFLCKNWCNVGQDNAGKQICWGLLFWVYFLRHYVFSHAVCIKKSFLGFVFLEIEMFVFANMSYNMGVVVCLGGCCWLFLLNFLADANPCYLDKNCLCY